MEISARIDRVINNLRSPVVFRGFPHDRWSLTQRMAHYGVPGASIALINDEKIEWSQAFGVLYSGSTQPVTEDTRFQAASISKPVSALAALRLVDRGMLSLDGDVNRYLESWKIPVDNRLWEGKVTLRRLLSHTAGLSVPSFQGYGIGTPMFSLSKLLKGSAPGKTEPVRVRTEPGTTFSYSGGGYGVLRLLMEEITGQSFAPLLQELVLGPLRMERSSFEPFTPSDPANSAAHGHHSDGREIDGGWEIDVALSSAGLWSTPTDLCRFALALAKSTRGSGSDFLSPHLVREMLSSRTKTGLSGRKRWMGMGIFCFPWMDDWAFCHSGSNAGYKSLFLASGSGKRGVAVMTNGDAGDLLIEEIIQSIAREYNWPECEQKIVERITLPHDHISTLTGRYRLATDQAIDVTPCQDGLSVKTPRSIELFFYPVSGSYFYSTASQAPLIFKRNCDGRTFKLVWRGQAALKTGQCDPIATRSKGKHDEPR